MPVQAVQDDFDEEEVLRQEMGLNEEEATDEVDEEPVDNETVEQVPADTPAQDEDEFDNEEYGKRVKKRIDKEVWKRKAAIEERDHWRQEAEKYRQMYDQTAKEYANTSKKVHESYSGTINQQLEELQRQRKDAAEEGDSLKLMELTDRYYELREQSRNAPPVYEYKEPERPSAPQQSEPPEVQTWMKKNSGWFNNHNPEQVEMAQLFYQKALQSMDIDSALETVDKKMRAVYPELFDYEQRQQRESAVSPPTSGKKTAQSRSFTDRDKREMRSFGLDPDNAAHRKEWLRNSGGE